MGDPRKQKKQYAKPFKAWQRERLEAEKPVLREFGLKNKMELWRTSALLRRFTGQAKRLTALHGKQADIEKKQMMSKLNTLGLISPNASLDEVLGLTVNDFLARRLQTIVFKKNLAHTMDQARQFIVHRHIKVGDKIITSPSYMVPVTHEPQVSFVDRSALSKADHPERAIKAKPVAARPAAPVKEGYHGKERRR